MDSSKELYQAGAKENSFSAVFSAGFPTAGFHPNDEKSAAS
jgi:hypothetical protein